MGRIAGGYPKPWASLAAVEAFPKLSSFLTDKLFCMEMWGGGVGGGGGWRTGRDAKGTCSKTSCGCFYPLNSCKYTCTNTHCKLSPSLAALCNTYTHKQIQECLCSGAEITCELHYIYRRLISVTYFSKLDGIASESLPLPLNWNLPQGFCKQRTQSVWLSRSSHP